jgi:hypothetical protein
MYQRAYDELFAHLASDQASATYVRKHEEYLDLAIQIVRSPDMRYRFVVDQQNGLLEASWPPTKLMRDATCSATG